MLAAFEYVLKVQHLGVSEEHPLVTEETLGLFSCDSEHHLVKGSISGVSRVVVAELEGLEADSLTIVDGLTFLGEIAQVDRQELSRISAL